MDIYRYGSADAPSVLIQPVDEHDLSLMDQEADLIGVGQTRDIGLIAIKVDDWNRDLSPWEASAVFGDQAFGGGAQETLMEIKRLCDDPEKKYYIGGYSLAGLFALWAVTETDIFAGAAAASPSVWFSGFTAYLDRHDIRTGSVYLSLGDKEEKTKNQVMACVGEQIKKTYSIIRGKGVNCILEWNKGNHFMDSEKRTARAFEWVLGSDA